MKKPYRKPIAKKVDYAFEEQIAAASYPISNYADPWNGNVCTYGDGQCSLVYNTPTKARGLDNCIMYPGVPLPNK